MKSFNRPLFICFVLLEIPLNINKFAFGVYCLWNKSEWGRRHEHFWWRKTLTSLGIIYFNHQQLSESTEDLHYLHYTHLIQVYRVFNSSYRTISKTSLTTIVDHGESISTRFRRYRLILTQSTVMKSTNVQCLNSFKHIGKSIKIQFRRKVRQIYFIDDSIVYLYQYDNTRCWP